MSNEHIKILKMILRKGEYPISESEPLGNQLHYLGNLEYICLINDYGVPSNPRYIVTEKGKAFLSEYKNHKREFWVPYVITTLISVFALMKSYGFGIDDLITWCMK